MKLKNKIQKILPLVYWTTGVLCFIFILGFSGEKQHAATFKSISINIDDESGLGFIDRQDVLDLLNSKVERIIGTPVYDINTGMLEKVINANPFVYKAEVYSTINGELHIDIVQRNPIIRIINNKEEHFYIDNEGKYMPVSDKYTAPVAVANGNILDTYVQQKVHDTSLVNIDTAQTKRVIDQLYQLGQFLQKDTLMNSLVEQIYVNEKMELELIPRIGDQVILMGDISNMEEKFKNLIIFYKEGLNKTGWDKYSTINLQYKDQVVCTKKNISNTKNNKQEPVQH